MPYSHIKCQCAWGKYHIYSLSFFTELIETKTFNSLKATFISKLEFHMLPFKHCIAKIFHLKILFIENIYTVQYLNR